MVEVKFIPSLEIWNCYEDRLTSRRFKMIVENVVYEAMEACEHDAVAEITVGTAKYFVVCDTWQEFARVYGEVNVFKDSLDNLPFYTKYLTLAD